ncbi:MAG: phenylacetate--CoA ligase [Acidobacteria bacterium]|nr:phenylacetate--CoA ligase [Acidobacteriota bacterium]MXZ72091.1 phenylacetate--CoA ligase [Acidobacteriota bacterium]MYD72452.1 phenylacetate--CoA ligase [Acidobacteriota bacterium]MYJ04599.1 phenylacetate--CoA ligase [Acidobacteriota bacterium]
MTEARNAAPSDVEPGASATRDECRSREAIAAAQEARLQALLRAIRGRNAFYDRKFTGAGINVDTVLGDGGLTALPFTTKEELVADQASNPPWGTALTEPLERYARYNQTSSTTGEPLRWLDTPESWQWMLDCWKAVYRAAGVTSRDRILFPFSFGPFLGFWTGFDAAVQIGAHAIPAGGMTSKQRIGLIRALAPTVVCCTPTYALRLLDVSLETDDGPSLAENPIRLIIVAGEPGGSIPATRQRIERGWEARVIDHHGMTEVGPVSFECRESPGSLHINEREFIAEVIHPESGRPVPDGKQGELVLTNLGRTASPVIRYRTRDLAIRTSTPCVCGRTFARLEGGIAARTDDMVSVRGVNVYPSAIETVVRAIDDVVEYRCTVRPWRARHKIALEVEVAPGADKGSAIAAAASRLREATGLAIPVTAVHAGSLPRFDMKARRFVVERSEVKQ